LTLLGLTDVTKRHGDRVVLDGVSLGVERGDRVGVIGVNGSGKSTLLRLAAGPRATVTGGHGELDEPDTGSVVHARDARVHFVGQEPRLADDATPVEVALAGDTPAATAARRFAAASAAARRAKGSAAGDDAELAELEAATAQMDAQGGWAVESAARAVLDRLGVDRVEAPLAQRSGGERKRVALAAALAEPPDVLILDEPTNHLDVAAVEWLQGQLRAWTGALLLVTHDRYLLDAVATRVVEVHRGTLHAHQGGYASYLQAREQRRAQAEAAARRAANRARQELAYLRQGAKARTTKSKARVAQAQQAVEAAEPDGPDDEQLRVELPTPRLGAKVINLHNAGVAVARGADRRWVLSDLDWKLGPHERMGVVGPNGSGKTTLLRLLAGEIEPDAGSRRAGETVRVGIYRQRPDDLAGQTRVRDVIEAEVRSAELTSGHRVSSSQLLERFLFDAALQRAYVEELSGGERRRLELLRVLAQAPNVLLLDEPTNDLDLDTLGVLEDYLDQWPGAAVVASHDRYVLDRVCGQVVAVEDGILRHYPGGWRDWKAAHAGGSSPLESSRGPTAEAETAVNPSRACRAPQGRRERKRSYHEEREMAAAEARLADLTQRRDELAARLQQAGDNHQHAAELGTQLAWVNDELSQLEERWLELAMIGEDA
jgi:ATP-binding cassette subfamily F protein uup